MSIRSAPFPVANTGNAVIVVTAASQRVAIPGDAAAGNTLLVKNVGTSMCYLATGNVTVVATAASGSTATNSGSFPIAPGEIGAYTFANPNDTHVAAVAASGDTSNLYISRGRSA